jgi:hypothetical protein
MERVARSKHSSFLRKFIAYDHKKFYNIGPTLILVSYAKKPGVEGSTAFSA